MIFIDHPRAKEFRFTLILLAPEKKSVLTGWREKNTQIKKDNPVKKRQTIKLILLASGGQFWGSKRQKNAVSHRAEPLISMQIKCLNHLWTTGVTLEQKKETQNQKLPRSGFYGKFSVNLKIN